MRRFVLTTLAAIALATAAPAQELKDIWFPESFENDPTFMTKRVVILQPVSFVYYCEYIFPFNRLYRGYGDYQGFRDNIFTKCNYLGRNGQFLQYSSLELKPLVSWKEVRPVPTFVRQTPEVPEVAMIYEGQFIEGGKYYVVLAHPVVNGQIQTAVGRDLTSAVFGG